MNCLKKNINKIVLSLILLIGAIFILNNLIKINKDIKILKKESVLLNNKVHKDENVSLAQDINKAKDDCYHDRSQQNFSEECEEILKIDTYIDHDFEVHFGKGDY